ncbi:MAG: hypothetical protein DI589_18755 [Shinella sp.]|uniref:hypothetical protein n=1 Tax=uncultured Flavobacterium sp. TaxID=165435 RepID=UPI000DB56F51|nr:hypothetical protein [uncultured Flavobacterium sp.]PZU20135.1 MAG: hypothetical protein DI589_18755 [Shinella sp.]
MNNIKDNTTIEQPNKLYSFIESVKGFLKAEKKKYPVLFTFSQKVYVPKIAKESFSSMLVICWYENRTGEPEIFFKNETGQPTRFTLNDLPYERCIQIEVHEDYSEHLHPVGIFKNYEDFALSLSGLLDLKKKQVKISFPYPVYIPQFSLEPKKSFLIYGNINPLSEDNGKTWKNKICLFAEEGSKIFQEATVIPFESCLEISIVSS